MNDETSTAQEKRAVKQLMVSTLMGMDKNIEEDIDEFVTGIINAKKPKVKVNGEIPLIPVGKDGKFTTAGSKINEIDKLFKDPFSYKMSFGGDNKMFIKPVENESVDNFTGEVALYLTNGDPVVQIDGKPITFNIMDPEGVKMGMKMAGDKLMTWAEKADFDYYLNNVNYANFILQGAANVNRR